MDTYEISDDERRGNMQRVVAAEMRNNPEQYWWLSFIDPNLPEGYRFLGGSIVRAHGIATALRASHEQGCNPGGAVSGTPIPPNPTLEAFVSEYANTLLSKSQIDRMEEQIQNL